MQREIILKITVSYNGDWTEKDQAANQLIDTLYQGNDLAQYYEDGVLVGPIEVVSIGTPINHDNEDQEVSS